MRNNFYRLARMMAFIGTKEAAKLLGVSESYIRKLCRQGRLKAKLIPPFEDRWAISRAEIERFKRTRRSRGRPKKSRQ